MNAYPAAPAPEHSRASETWRLAAGCHFGGAVLWASSLQYFGADERVPVLSAAAAVGAVLSLVLVWQLLARRRWAAWLGLGRAALSLLLVLAVMGMLVYAMLQPHNGRFDGLAFLLELAGLGVVHLVALPEVLALLFTWRALRGD